MRSRWLGFSVSVLVAALFVLVLAVPALGVSDLPTTQWGNGNSGGYYRGTHGWIMYNAARMASHHGVGWMNYGIAVDASAWPDTKFADNIDHNYDRWGNYPSWYNSSWHQPFGNPQVKVQQYYNAAVAALRRGDTYTASEDLGIMSHYWSDIHQPMHTEESARETRAVHTGYETAVDSRLPNPDSHQDWIKDDGYQYVASPSALTVSEAVYAHNHYYSSLVNNYADHGFNSTVEDITSFELNRAVNGLSDLIVSAYEDAHQVNAVIDHVSPSAVTTGQVVSFAGHGTDSMHHGWVAWQWRSSIDGLLSGAASFTTTSLSVGIHTIFFEIHCDSPTIGKWSPEVTAPLVVGAYGTVPKPVYRFYNFKKGVHFYTADETEKQHVLATLSSTYRLDGVAYALDASSTAANTAPLYRFYNKVQGVHFYTADAGERDRLIHTMANLYRYEGVAYYVSLSPTGTSPVYRFYNFKKGVHFYTASADERDSVIAKLRSTYRYEGVAFSYDPPW